jgi:general secretion pathway protein D
VQLPLQFQIFNITSAALAALNSPNLQAQIAQLIASGQLNPNDLSSIAALISQFQNQASALLANPVATFGGGLTLFAVGIPPVTANFSLNQSRVTNLEETTLRAAQGNTASMHVGTRFPVLTQSFTSGFSALGSSTGNVLGAVPGFNYEDLGVTLKAKPQVHGTSAVTLDVELEIRSLGAQSINNIPIIQNRTYKGVITVAEGEPAVMAGILSRTESRTLAGVPALGHLPLFDRLLSNEGKNETDTELVVVITPHIVSSAPHVTPVVAVGQ